MKKRKTSGRGGEEKKYLVEKRFNSPEALRIFNGEPFITTTCAQTIKPRYMYTNVFI